MPGDEEVRRLLAGCDETQRLAITTPATPLLVVAGAGSGKTRVLTRRIARRVLDGSAVAAHVLALTFTRRAAGELRARLRALGLADPVAAGTFHALALRELRNIAADRGDRPPVVLDSKTRLLAGLVPPARHDLLATIAAEIDWAKARRIAPEAYPAAATAAGRPSVAGRARVAELFAAYESEKRKRRVLDFDDLLTTLATRIEQDRDVASMQRWRFRHLFVDELQDVSPSQLRLLHAWLGGREDLCAVGDPHQAIYAWSGAEPGVLSSFAEHFPGASVVHLDANYRSSPQVVAVATAALHGPDAARRALVPTTRSDGSVPTITCFTSDADERAGVVAALRRTSRPGRRWSCSAVLARTNAQLAELRRSFDDAGIPSRTGAAGGLLARPEVRSVLARAHDRSNVAAFYALVDDLDLDLRAAGSGQAGTGSEADPEAREALESLAALAHEYRDEDPHPTLDGFASWARATLRSDPALGDGDAVTLSTFHRAKGLEWPVVFVTGLEAGLVPLASARSPDALEEERRLLYVALSRAGEELHCSWALHRDLGGRTTTREPSPFLGPIATARDTLERLARPDPDAARRAIAASRALLGPSRNGS